jgi:hypothetical protein
MPYSTPTPQLSGIEGSFSTFAIAKRDSFQERTSRREVLRPTRALKASRMMDSMSRLKTASRKSAFVAR